MVASRRVSAFAAVAVTALLSLLGVLHYTSFHHHVHTRYTHQRVLRELQSSPSLRLVFHVNRPSMQVHGHSDFEVLVQPVASGDAVHFNGVVSFTDEAATHTYAMVDGAVYYTLKSADGKSTVTTVDPSSLPSVKGAIEAIAAAKPIDGLDAASQAIACPAESKLLQTTYGGEDFVLCGTKSEASGLSLHAFSSDLSVDIVSSTEDVVIEKPANAEPLPSDIEPVSAESLNAPTNFYDILVGATSDSVSRALSNAENHRALVDAPTCACKSKPRPCIFFHGMDVKADGGLQDANKKYFGDIQEHAPCCTTSKFAFLNTVDYGWNNAILVKKACDFALQMSSSSDKSSRTIEDTIIVAHSMGNLMLGHAVATGECKLGASSSWVALSGPLKGSMGSDFQIDVCDGGGVGGDALKAVVGLFGQCPSSLARQVLTYQSGKYSSETLNQQYTAVQKVHEQHVTASMCGSSFSGLLSGDYAGLLLGGSILPHKSSENDGVVEFQSCIGNLPATKFGGDYTSQFFKAKLNHADTSFHNGDALFDNAKKPVKWFECLL
ncbi:hypothetical protein Poli38472_005151 [Pythium oligandrum]|uniref:Uncharacterized protein n=1 Tax=Pythium oligandrum TaxID=41045 RepID=A0A8K1FLC3_PYTOL|nr:hypothetical protein Poli38472_005151 [Pythium oligandrum]|eukprot:TMW62533.1 hypothetical protein Poli38472_005151 [Pythium oligandrum]